MLQRSKWILVLAAVANIVSVGVIRYELPGTAFRPTTEVYGGLNLNIPLNPYINWYHDVQSIRPRATICGSA